MAEQTLSEQQKSILPKEGDIKVVDGVKLRWENTGYTFNQYFSHSTGAKGPGPGWDSRERLLDKKWTMNSFGRRFSAGEVFDPSKLPNTPYCKWTKVEKEASKQE